MDISPITQQPIPPQDGGSKAKWIVIALVGLVVILGGVYFVMRSAREVTAPGENTVSAPPPPSAPASANVDDAILQDIRQVSAGATSADIQSDIDATDLQSLDDELKNLEQEMKGL